MKVGNTINGITVTDVKRVNKLNLIQFLKEVDNYLQQGYQIDVNSARQVGLVLQTDMFKTEAASSVKVGSTGEKNVESDKTESPKLEETKVEDTKVESVEVDQPKEAVSVEEAPKKTTTRSKKTAQ